MSPICDRAASVTWSTDCACWMLLFDATLSPLICDVRTWAMPRPDGSSAALLMRRHVESRCCVLAMLALLMLTSRRESIDAMLVLSVTTFSSSLKGLALWSEYGNGRIARIGLRASLKGFSAKDAK